MKVRHSRGHLELNAEDITVTHGPSTQQPAQLLRIPLRSLHRLERRRTFGSGFDLRLRTDNHDPDQLAHPDTDPHVVHLSPWTPRARRRVSELLTRLVDHLTAHRTHRPVLVDVPTLVDHQRPTERNLSTSQWRYHPPPNWDVPPDFTPPVGWRPNPAWGPAPDGWTFWLPANPSDSTGP